MAARILNILAGAWLFVSAFLWQHTVSQFTNTWVVGALVALVALAAMAVPAARYLNTALAVWLFVSVWALPTEAMATWWNNLILAVIVFFLSLVPSHEPRTYYGRARATEV